jgi:hypothetical protein
MSFLSIASPVTVLCDELPSGMNQHDSSQSNHQKPEASANENAHGTPKPLCMSIVFSNAQLANEFADDDLGCI